VSGLHVYASLPPTGISRITRTSNGKMSDYILKHATAFDMEKFLHG
jgi:hypothetical protein